MTDVVLGMLAGLGISFVLAAAFLVVWKARYTKAIRRDAVERSVAVTAGKVHEQLVPHLPGFSYNPKDVRFLGSPVDYVVFDGLANGRVERVVFLEVKTGGSGLSARERWVKDAIDGRRVEWREWRVGPGNRSAASAEH